MDYCQRTNAHPDRGGVSANELRLVWERLGCERMEEIVKRRGVAPSAAIRIAGLSFIADGGFAVAMPIALSHLARHGELPMTRWGFRAFSGERLSHQHLAALGWALTGVCVLDVVAGAWLWQGRKRGATLGLATTPLALALGAGFALPFLLMPAPIRAALVLARRRSLNR